jgi:phage portal protein BeeE
VAGAFRRAWNWLAVPVETRSSPEPSGWTLAELLAETADPTAAGITVNADTALRHTGVWSCVRLLSDSVSSLPVHAEQDGRQIDKPRVLV